MKDDIEVEVIFYSKISGNTKFFVDRLGIKNKRIPEDGNLIATTPYVLIFPSYGGGRDKGSVPKPVVEFIKKEENRRHILGIVGSGDRNYGDKFCQGAKMLSEKIKIPILYKYEIRGTNNEVNDVREGILKIQEELNKNIGDVK